MKTKATTSAFLVSVGLLAGCTGSTDPTTATLFDNIVNLESGEYDRQISENEAQAQAILRNNRASEQRISSLEQQRSANAGAISSLRSQIASVRSQGAAARQAASSDPAKQAQVRALDAQLASVEREVNSGVADPDIARSELRRIQSAYRAIAG